jgi:hypothetical protein
MVGMSSKTASISFLVESIADLSWFENSIHQFYFLVHFSTLSYLNKPPFDPNSNVSRRNSIRGLFHLHHPEPTWRPTWLPMGHFCLYEEGPERKMVRRQLKRGLGAENQEDH